MNKLFRQFIATDLSGLLIREKKKKKRKTITHI